jgi:endonuclease YncB( thermonuclease family)
MRVVSILALFLLSVMVPAAEIRGKVVAVLDGDTVTVLDDLDKAKFRIRLSGIDAPEKKQAFGAAAKKHLSGLIFGKMVSVRFKEVDRYGRIVGTIWIDGEDINRRMLRDGMAWHYSLFDKTPEYAEAERLAREKKRGLWIERNPVDPHHFRKMTRRKK